MTSELEPEDAERAAMTLLGQKNVDGAIDLLQRARSAARSRRDSASASHFSSLIGSLHLSEGRVAEALREYESAEADEPSNAYHKLTNANRLLDAERPAEALQKLDAVAGALPDNPSIRHGYHALRGEAQMQLGKIDEAVHEFRMMSAPSLVSAVMPVSLDLDLAALLIREGILRDECLRYLRHVRAKAESRNDAALVQRVTRLEVLADGKQAG
jgi:tetratricopeptide (TPR) repeat protein